MGGKPNWATIHTWRKAPVATLRRATPADHCLNAKEYTAFETEVSLLAAAAARAPRERWLRGVLDACED